MSSHFSEFSEEPSFPFDYEDPSFAFGRRYAARHFRIGHEEFSQLSNTHNSFTISIQDPIAFNTDVAEVIQTASTWAEFQEKLQVRSQTRLKELKSAFDEVSQNIIGRPSLLTQTDHTTWGFAGKLFRNQSIASLTEFFASFGPKDGETNRELPASGPPAAGESLPAHLTEPSAYEGEFQGSQPSVPDMPMPMPDAPVTRKAKAGPSNASNSKPGTSKAGTSKTGNPRAGKSKADNSKADSSQRITTRSATSKAQIVTDNKHTRKSDRVMKATAKENPRRSSRLKQKADALKKCGVV